MTPIITEKELEEIFYSKRKKPKKLFRFLKPTLMFIGLTIFFYCALNYKSLYANLGYWYDTEYKNEPSKKINLNAIFESNQDQKVSSESSETPMIPDDTISIPEIYVEAPIIWNVANIAGDVSSGLAKGTIHIKGTALPGQVGNVFITGHSSNYPWAKGKYNNIFSLLKKLIPGDLIQIKYQNTNYIYKVSASKVVKPDNISVMSQGSDSILSLMTCTPVGTSINRLVVTAKQVYPDPSSNIKNINNSTIITLPSAR